MKTVLLGLLFAIVSGGCNSSGDPADAGADAGDAGDAASGSDDGGQTEDGDPAVADDPGEDGDGKDGDGTESDAGADSGADAGTDAGDGDADPQPVPVCRWACQAPLDCSGGIPGPYDEENYACTDGVCRWLGCFSDEDCQAQLGMENYVCRHPEGWDTPSCFMACLLAEDCVGELPTQDLDNYACTDGICDYLGCNSDEECRINPNFAHYVCTGDFTNVPMCMPSCFTPQDCDMGAPAYDADNYDCTDGVCIYAGCNSDQECSETMPTHEVVCD